MVVPAEETLLDNEVAECVGNNLKLNICHNRNALTVIGNNCTVRLAENSGFIKIIGNNCEIAVQKGNGTIEYVGNNGKIFLGPDLSKEIVNYIGRNGSVCASDGSSSDIKNLQIPKELKLNNELLVTVIDIENTAKSQTDVSVMVPRVRQTFRRNKKNLTRRDVLGTI